MNPIDRKGGSRAGHLLSILLLWAAAFAANAYVMITDNELGGNPRLAKRTYQVFIADDHAVGILRLGSVEDRSGHEHLRADERLLRGRCPPAQVLRLAVQSGRDGRDLARRRGAG